MSAPDALRTLETPYRWGDVAGAVTALLGFSWEIVKRGDRIEVSGPTPLGPEDWGSHLPYLTRRYRHFRLRKWRFVPGFADGPLP